MRYRLQTSRWFVVREPGAPSPRVLSQPENAAALGADLVAGNADDQEHFWVVLLNTQNHYLSASKVAMGTQQACLVDPKAIFRVALLGGATAVILLHNHPSGDPTPSHEDVRLTRQLVECAHMFELRVHDHIIIGNGTGRWESLARKGLL